jgi:small subunit ribosomal protein S13
MIYILQKNLPANKLALLAIQEIFGIGPFISTQIANQLGWSKKTRIADLSSVQVDQLVRLITQYYKTGPDLQRSVQKDIARLIQIGCFRGIRHNKSNRRINK